MFEELETVVLKTDLPQHGLKAGDIGTVVHRYEDGRRYEVEFVAGDGRTLAVLTLEEMDVRPILEGEILHVRALSTV